MATLVNAGALLAWLGHGAIAGIFLVLLAETGLLVGFLLPGDSLLLTAGLLSAVGTGPARLPLPWVLVAATAGTVLGSQLGYLLGRRAGGRLRAHGRDTQLAAAFERTERLLARFGVRRALIISRFVPVVRTVIGPTAGAVGVPARFFALWQTLGAALWTVGVTTAGYAVGRLVPGAEHTVDIAVALPVLLLPLLVLCRTVARAFRRRRYRAVRARRSHRSPRSATRETPSVPECPPASLCFGHDRQHRPRRRARPPSRRDRTGCRARRPDRPRRPRTHR
ncbi:DedA family protein [Actinospica durhamensis]|uniref:DedA family protein n=1 Tax=Actinospica durhamensis TaxID=1508375 RepID=A0A941EUI5_9ACTN|nr:DedA family protein [Actinospica durhamensis]MBR7838580.1 DedA family protein [Actinospica durhamensis]